MSRILESAWVIVVGSLIGGCGPTVSEMRLASGTPRAANCELEFRRFEMTDLAPGSTWEVLGHVALGDTGVQDPLKEEYRAEVRPRACAMGGEAVGILMSATSTPMAFAPGGTGVDYVVVRKRTAPTASVRPQKF